MVANNGTTGQPKNAQKSCQETLTGTKEHHKLARRNI
jgi:acyl-coenzyme A synthetase/AMP-(fatty) acid ligase